MIITKKVWGGGRKKKTMLTIFEDHDKTLLKQWGPQWKSRLPCPVLITLWPEYFLLPFLTCNLIHFIYLYLLLRTIWWAVLGILCLDSLQVPRVYYLYLVIEIFRFTPDPQTLLFLPKRSRLSMIYKYLFVPGVNLISLPYFFLTTVWIYSPMGVLYLYYYTRHT